MATERNEAWACFWDIATYLSKSSRCLMPYKRIVFPNKKEHQRGWTLKIGLFSLKLRDHSKGMKEYMNIKNLKYKRQIPKKNAQTIMGSRLPMKQGTHARLKKFFYKGTTKRNTLPTNDKHEAAHIHKKLKHKVFPKSDKIMRNTLPMKTIKNTRYTLLVLTRTRETPNSDKTMGNTLPMKTI